MLALTKLLETNRLWPCEQDNFKITTLMLSFFFTDALGSSACRKKNGSFVKGYSWYYFTFWNFGSHLDAANKTIIVNLEIRNFEAADKILAEIWSESIIVNRPVGASYKSTLEKEHHEVVCHKSEEWKAQHVRQSQYMLQMIKCSDSFCCKTWRTNYSMFFPRRFLPAPVPILTSDNDLKIDPKKGSFRSLLQFFYFASTWKLDTCYNEYCPPLQERNAKNERVIDRQTYKNCSLYHSTIATMKKRKRD